MNVPPIVNHSIVRQAMNALLSHEFGADDAFERLCAAQLLHAVFSGNDGEPFKAILAVQQRAVPSPDASVIWDAMRYIRTMVHLGQEALWSGEGPPTEEDVAARAMIRRGEAIANRLEHETGRPHMGSCLRPEFPEMRCNAHLTLPDGHEQWFTMLVRFDQMVMEYAGRGLGGLLRTEIRSLMMNLGKTICEYVDGRSGTS